MFAFVVVGLVGWFGWCKFGNFSKLIRQKLLRRFYCSVEFA